MQGGLLASQVIRSFSSGAFEVALAVLVLLLC